MAEVTTPLHITVRVIDAPVEKDCQGTTLERLKCTFSPAERQGCVYVEVGAGADTPELSKTIDPHRCQLIAGSTRAVLVHQPSKKASITVDSTKRRAIIELREASYVIYVRQGELVVTRKAWDIAAPGAPGTIGALPPGTIDWSRVPPFLSVIDEDLLLTMPEAELDSMIAESKDGQEQLETALLSLVNSADLNGEGWARAFSKLGPTERAHVREELVRSVSDGTGGALEWFEAHPEEQKDDFIEALTSSAESETFDLGTTLPLLMKFTPEKAETIACDHLERRWHEYRGSPYDYDYYPPNAAALAVLVTRKAKCPWVVPLLLRSPCGAELHCDPDPDDGKVTPLCTAAQTEKPLARALNPDRELSVEESEVVESDWGPLLLAAARLQGPLPADFLRADERRLYTQTFTFKGNEEDDACRQLSSEPADWACSLPISIHKAFNEGCTLELDDAKKTMTLTAPPVEEEN